MALNYMAFVFCGKIRGQGNKWHARKNACRTTKKFPSLCLSQHQGSEESKFSTNVFVSRQEAGTPRNLGENVNEYTGISLMTRHLRKRIVKPDGIFFMNTISDTI